MANLDFDNTQKAFALKNDGQLNRSYWLFRLMQKPILVNFFSRLTVQALKIGLPIGPLVKATIFKQFCAGETLQESESVVALLKKVNVGSILDYSIEGKEREEDFDNTRDELLRIVALAKTNRSIPYTCLKLTGIARHDLLVKVNDKKALTAEEQKELDALKARYHEICASCEASDVPIYIDAEDYCLQGAIDSLTEEMMKKYNTKKAIIQTTAQLYRWDRLDYIKQLIIWARKEHIFIGLKLVRGAYWEKENERAHQMGYKSPVHSLKADTDRDYDKALDLCLENIDIVSICAGTHNEASTLHLVAKMKELGIPNTDKRICCSQLFGMSDHITYNLAESGYNVTKYLPYGPVKSVLPYLVRRAQENTSIAGQMSRELRLISEEKKRRHAPQS